MVFFIEKGCRINVELLKMKSKLFIITAITEASKTTFFTNGAEKISSSGKSKLFIHQPITPAGCEKWFFRRK
ncbi:MAG: hypothetical protein DRP76_04095 [Candidatus Omnitrophota bacterium]|nr:MAG: hypothetical protein DRP76_04095 [Candidatus Omnitrophota bacterium]